MTSSHWWLEREKTRLHDQFNKKHKVQYDFGTGPSRVHYTYHKPKGERTFDFTGPNPFMPDLDRAQAAADRLREGLRAHYARQAAKQRQQQQPSEPTTEVLINGRWVPVRGED